MEITRETRPTRTVAVVRRRLPMAELPAFYDTAYRAVGAQVAAAGGEVTGPAIGWYHGMPDPTVDVAAGFGVDGLAEGALDDDVVVLPLPGGDAAVATYVGPYDGLGEAWAVVEAWRSRAGVAGRGDFYEEYVTDPSPEGDPNRNVTRLVLPLA